MLPVAVARSYPDDNVLRYMYFRFVDDIIFSHNGTNEPKSETMRMYDPLRQMTAPVGR